MRLIPNAGTVAAKASSMWALYGAFLIDAGIKILEYIQDNRQLKWQDMLVPIALIVVAAFRLTYQASLATATERKLQAERIARERLEKEATSAGPPISKREAEVIKMDAAASAAGVDV